MLTLRVDSETGSFDDGELRRFCDVHDVVSVSEHHFVFEGIPSVALLLTWREPAGSRVFPPESSREPREEPELSDAEKPLYAALRKWRNDRARRDGRPAYVLFTNAQLAAIARLRPTTRAALESVPGVGEARLRDYADELILLVQGLPHG